MKIGGHEGGIMVGVFLKDVKEARDPGIGMGW
jgi:hypothetical protein